MVSVPYAQQRGPSSYAFNGLRYQENRLLLDGIGDNENHNGLGVVIFPPIDAIREFSEETTDADARYGRGNGGLNTSYKKPIQLLGSTRGCVDLGQVFISPTLACKVGGHNDVGVAANIAVQRAATEGLQSIEAISSDPTHVTNTGYSYSSGARVRVGWLGELNHVLSAGATWQSKTYVSKFSKYSGLFAEQGRAIFHPTSPAA